MELSMQKALGTGVVNRKKKSALIAQQPYHLLMLPGIIMLSLFWLIPLIIGFGMPFQRYRPALGFFGSEWVGLKNFRTIFSMNNFRQILFNTIYIAGMKMFLGLLVTIFISLLLNEIRNIYFKRTIQTLVYFPHFLSWVLLGSILIDFLSPSVGLLNNILAAIGIKRVFFLADKNWFPFVMVFTDIWKEFGWSTIIILAAMTNIDPTHYEAAVIDGAGRLKQTWHITLPGIRPIIVLSIVLSLGGILNAGFDQILNMYSPIVYETGDILDTAIYRMGLLDRQYSVSAAIGLFKSVVSITLILASYRLADRVAGYRVI